MMKSSRATINENLRSSLDSGNEVVKGCQIFWKKSAFYVGIACKIGAKYPLCLQQQKQKQHTTTTAYAVMILLRKKHLR